MKLKLWVLHKFENSPVESKKPTFNNIKNVLLSATLQDLLFRWLFLFYKNESETKCRILYCYV